MQAIILAAGMGKRLGELTRENTKCMVRVNGVTLIERMLTQLDRLSLSRIIMVVGYQEKSLIDHISALPLHTPVAYIHNPIYDRTNNIYSLSLAKHLLSEDDTLLLESDLIFDDEVLSDLLEDPQDTLALVARYEAWMDGTVVRLDANDAILEMIPGKRFRYQDAGSYYKTVNIYKFSKDFSRTHYLPFLDAYTRALGENEYYEQVLRVIAMLDKPIIRAKRLEARQWYEIDDVQDLDIASVLFQPDPDEKMKMLGKRYGGYWRFPGLVDFCYLVNPYFPPKRMIDELQTSFETLLRQYPSGMGINALLAGKAFALHPEHIVVGNGASELIKALLELLPGCVGIIRPTFEEYPNRADKTVLFTPSAPDFSYTAEDVIRFFDRQEIGVLTLINPDNPSGNFIPREGLQRLMEWAHEKGIWLIVDESFVDFCDEPEQTLLQEETLVRYPRLIVVKSISKSFGVPGLRLGVAAGSDTELIRRLQEQVAIWNINSIAEYYLQIEGKYRGDYRDAMRRFRETRARFQALLGDIPGLRIIPSQANYFLCELVDGHSAKRVASQLLATSHCLVKELTSKLPQGQYLRIAIRGDEDNTLLARSLAAVLRRDANVSS